MYRVKEYNSAYDNWFVENKGWILITNIVSWKKAVKVALSHEACTGLKTEIVQWFSNKYE